MRCWLLLWLAWLGTSRSARAHGSESHRAGWSSWNAEPGLLIALVGGLYGLGLQRLWGRLRTGRTRLRREAIAFLGGLGALAVALASPLDALSAELSSAHMVQHMTLMLVAAPLLVAGRPLVVLLWAFPLPVRKGIGRWWRRLRTWRAPWYALSQPLVLWSLYALTLWIWHLPALYQAALDNRLIHDTQHLAFLGSSCLFWWVLLDPLERLRMSRGIGIFYLFTTSLHATVLGVFMTLSPAPWYPAYRTTTENWGLTLMEDQQLAGLIMWMPACMVYAVVAALLFALWLREPLAPGKEAQKGAVGFKTLLLGCVLLLGLWVAADLVLRGLRQQPVSPVWSLPGADPGRGRMAIEKHGCGSCHVIPGIRQATGRVGPELRGLIGQVYLAGRLPNTPDNLIRWIRDPQGVSPGTAMPDLGVTADEARDIAAHLYQQSR